MSLFRSYLSLFRNYEQAETDVANAKEASKTEPVTTVQITKTNRNHGGQGTNDEFGRLTKAEQDNIHTRGGTREMPDIYVSPDRSPTLVSNYVDNVIGRSIDYSQTKAYKRAYSGYSTGTMFSAGVSRLGSLASLFSSAISNPFGSNNQQRSSYWA